MEVLDNLRARAVGNTIAPPLALALYYYPEIVFWYTLSHGLNC